jgi:phosphatidate cytidylyltransferase
MKTRIIAAVVLLPLLLIVVLVAPKFCTGIVFGLMSALAAYELLQGTKLITHARLTVYAMVSAFWCALWSSLGIGYGWLLLGILIFWIALFAEVMVSQMKIEFTKIVICLAAGVVVPLLFSSVVRIHSWEKGRYYILVPFIIAFLSDTGAYFAGLNFGKHKLAPEISPKKTIEGVVGGVLSSIMGMIVCGLVLNVFFDFTVNFVFAAIYGLFGALAGVFGDLCFSVIKRQTDIKDFGNLIPGHGGILDRFDSMIVVGPLVEVLLLLMPFAV